MVVFDIKNDALALPQSLDYYVKNGLTSNVLIMNLKNLGVKFESKAMPTPAALSVLRTGTTSGQVLSSRYASNN